MKKDFLRLFLAVALLSASLTSCEILTGILSDLSSVANLANCTYDLKNVSNVYIAGVNVKNACNGNITATDVVKLSAALLSKKVPLSMDVNVNVTNPTTQQASLTAMDWICEIDGTQFANGNSNKTYNITPNNTTAVPLSVNADIYSMFSKDGIESLKKFVNSFSNDGTSSKVASKIKPSVNVAGTVVQSPKYITLEKKTGSTSNNNSGSGSTSTSTGVRTSTSVK